MKCSNIKYLILSTIFLCNLSGFATENDWMPEELKKQLLEHLQEEQQYKQQLQELPELQQATRRVTSTSGTTLTQTNLSEVLQTIDIQKNGANLSTYETVYNLRKNVTFSANPTNPQFASTTDPNATGQECMILISASDVTLDLNGFTLSTDYADLTAIIIEPNVKHVTIRNGVIGVAPGSVDPKKFLNGILCREGCADITLENIVIDQIVGGNPIDFQGTSSSPIKGVTLDTVVSVHHSGAVPYNMNFDYVNKVRASNITLDFTDSTSALVLVDIDNCNDISIEQFEASFNETTHASGVSAISMDTCNNVSIDGIKVHDNTGLFANGIVLDTVNTSSFSNITINDNSSASTTNGIVGFSINDVNHMRIENLSCSNLSQTGASGTPAITGLSATGTNSTISISDFSCIKNVSTDGAVTGISCVSTPNLSIDTAKIVDNGATDNSFTGISITSSPKSMLSNIDISNNTSDDEITYLTTGVSVTSSSSSFLDNINVSENSGGYQALGIVLNSSDNCTLQNCTTNHNSTGTGLAKVGQTVGISLVDSNYNKVKDCESSYNLGGDYDGSDAVGTPTADTDTRDGAAYLLRLLCAGYADYATVETAPNKNNIFDNCIARGNKTQWLHEVGTLPANVTSSGRFATQAALAAGFYLQSTRGSVIQNSSTEQNGGYHGTTGNAYVAGHGIHLEGTTLRTKLLNTEVSKHTWHGIYGFINTLTLLASQNFAFSNSTSTLAQDTTNGFGLSILNQNFHFPRLSENIPYNMTSTLDFSSITIEKRFENVIYYVVPDDSITY